MTLSNQRWLPQLVFSNIGKVYEKVPLGFFRLQSMSYCHPWLDCDDIRNDVKLFDNVVLSYGPPRLVRLAKWNKKFVSHNVPVLSHKESFENELAW